MDETRTDESRSRLVNAFYFALGAYTEQEAKKEDQWRDQSIGQLYAHLNHEVQEIRTNLKRDDKVQFLIHNVIDALSLSAIFLAKLMEEHGLADPSTHQKESQDSSHSQAG